jgi:hypothetical protein
VPQSFENLFSKWDQDDDGALTLQELFLLMHGNRCAADPFGVRPKLNVGNFHADAVAVVRRLF